MVFRDFGEPGKWKILFGGYRISVSRVEIILELDGFDRGTAVIM
jgi:hypothetical protein